jgi:hypothetical protein
LEKEYNGKRKKAEKFFHSGLKILKRANLRAKIKR